MAATLPNQIRSTAGAVPVLNEKGEFTMQKVKVTRYISGRRPEWAEGASESESSGDEEEGLAPGHEEPLEDIQVVQPPSDEQDRRLRRLKERGVLEADRSTQRLIEEPEVIHEAGGDGAQASEDEEGEVAQVRRHLSDSESSDEDLDEDTIEHRRVVMKEKALQKTTEKDVLDVIEEEVLSESEESSEYEEYTDSEDETGPRLKPVFVRKLERVTIREQDTQEKEEDELKKELEEQTKNRKKESLRLVATVVAEEQIQEQQGISSDQVINTDDENEEEEYEAWKVRELTRIKRDRETKELSEAEELEKIRQMSEEERREYFKNNPKFITNKAEKGKYKFLQKYYHRGAFYLENEENVFKRDFAKPTLEDHFDKTVLPKVMQVKNFGRSGRTKYTHLVDQDTTVFDSAWTESTPLNLKFQGKGGGARQIFDKPTYKKRKTM